ncbi:MAG: helix-turn-helix transcriptional regulator [bacterium]|nr:helix-turn-helix transcriptional regulator [bacterium]
MLKPLDTVLYRSSELTVGKFEVELDDPRFRDSGPIEQFPVVFPSTPIWIRHRGGDPFLTDRTRVVLYNRRQRYTRQAGARAGDRCHWFSFSRGIVGEIAASLDPEADRDRPYRFATAPCASETFLAHRLVVHQLSSCPETDGLFVEETLLALLRRILSQAYSFRGVEPRALRSRSNHRELAERVAVLLAGKYRVLLSLAQIAAAVGSSPFHLSRVFRRQTGSSIHGHRHQLRLRAGLEEVLETDKDLTEIALGLGFSSHSHFTGAFGRAFRWTPSELRKRASRRLLGSLAARLSGEILACHEGAPSYQSVTETRTRPRP